MDNPKFIPGWLKKVLDQASKEVNSWPEWKKSHEFKKELEEIKKKSSEEK